MQNGKNDEGQCDPNPTPVAKVGQNAEEIIAEEIYRIVLIGDFIVIIRQSIPIIKVDEIKSGKYEERIELSP